MSAQVRLPGERVKAHEVHFKLHAAEMPAKNAELTQARLKPLKNTWVPTLVILDTSLECGCPGVPLMQGTWPHMHEL